MAPAAVFEGDVDVDWRYQWGWGVFVLYWIFEDMYW